MKTVLITGASRGIGKAIAVEFYKNGYNVVINYNKSEKEAMELQALMPGSVAVKADVSNEKDVQHMVESVINMFGTIDVLVNNAGISQQKLFTDITSDDWNNMVGTNLNSVYYTCKYAVPHMISRKQGKIINISSMWGVTGASCEVHYSAVKAAVIGFTKALAKELGPSGITVNAVAPGTVMTDMCKGFDEETLELIKDETPLGKIGTPDDVAASVYFLAGEKADFMTGQVLSPNGGMVI
ncbi:MAG: 3-oxoacyl-ACP reductase FabG [Oscillospiraceae bacterium]|nr:3-oxoacyl-ACP reductase FabG [Oscillospiraceae bacterium]